MSIICKETKLRMCTCSTFFDNRFNRKDIRDPKVLRTLLYCPVRISNQPEKPKQTCGDDNIIVRLMTGKCGKEGETVVIATERSLGTGQHGVKPHSISPLRCFFLFHLELLKMWGKGRIFKGSLRALSRMGVHRFPCLLLL